MGGKKEAEAVMKLAEEAIVRAEQTDTDPEQVDRSNQAAIRELMLGNTRTALQLFLIALELAGTDQELRSQCLINIGDWLRRVKGELAAAQDLFDQAAKLKHGLVTISRLWSTRAMLQIYPLEAEKISLAAAGLNIENSIKDLQTALSWARIASKQRLPGALGAESFALHRLTGIVCQWGNQGQKRAVLAEIEAFLPRLDPDSDEVARLNYAKAVIIQEEQPLQAARLLLEAGIRMYEQSPLDAGPYLRRAGEIYLKLERPAMAWQCLRRAIEMIPLLQAHSNSQWEISLIRQAEAEFPKEKSES